MPDIGVDARDEALDAVVLPLVKPFGVPLAALPTAAGFFDQGVGAAAEGCVFGAPNEGNAASSRVSREGLLGADS